MFFQKDISKVTFCNGTGSIYYISVIPLFVKLNLPAIIKIGENVS